MIPFLIQLVAVVALALAVVGCGGDDGVSQSMHDNVMQERDQAQQQRDALQMQINALLTALNADDVAGAADQIGSLQTDLQAIQAALGTTDPAMVQSQINQLRADIKALQDAAQVRKDAAQDAMDKALADEARKIALGLDTPFPARSGPTFEARYGKPATVNVSFNSPTAANPNPNFKAEDATVLPMLDGWSGTKFVSTSANGSITDIMHAYINVEPDKQVPFAEWASRTSGVTFTNGVVTNPGVGTNAVRVAGAAFATGSGSKTHEKNVDTNGDGDLADADDLFQVSGTFAGAPGTYSCSGAACTSAVASSDGGVQLTGTWTFTPNTGAMAGIPDDRYANFGWWLRKADTGYLIRRFVGSNTPSTPDITTVAGTATYTGPAVGLYSIYDSGPKGGHFLAEAELKVDFGTAAQNGTMSGTVSNFSDGDGRDPASMDTWEVVLPELPIGSGALAPPAVGFTTTAAHRPVWKINGEAGTPASSTANWFALVEFADDSGTPQTGIGGFFVEYGVIGTMTGGFGVTHEGP